MSSIRKRLNRSILGVFALATIAICIATYLGISHEMDELYDANMRQLAVLASSITADRALPLDAGSYTKKWPKGEQIFLIQVFDRGALDYSSHPMANFPLQEKSGFGRVEFHGGTWSYYQENISGKTVQVSQNVKERRDVIHETYKAIIIPSLIQFPLMSIIIWLLTGYGFRPLSRISDLIQKRKVGFLSPIPPGDAPDEIKSLVTALNDLMRRLDAAMETQRRFTADAAHELRTPLTTVRLQLDLLKRAQSEEERDAAVQSLEQGVARSIHLVQQLLELARQEPDAAARPLVHVDLAALADQAALEQEPLARAKSITLHSSLEKAEIAGDAAHLKILIGNLLNNAIAYTSDGGTVELVTRRARDGLTILEVSDTGIGIPEGERHRVFDRFYRVVGTGTSGSGLGLSIVKSIAERHNAGIEISSGENGKGTMFRILFSNV